MTANRAVLDLASKYRENFLFNIYQMGRNSIQRGSRDSWTVTPKRIEAMKEAASKAEPITPPRGGQRGAAASADAAPPAGDSRVDSIPGPLAPFRQNSMNRSCTIQRCAILAVTSSLPINPILQRQPSSSIR